MLWDKGKKSAASRGCRDQKGVKKRRITLDLVWFQLGQKETWQKGVMVEKFSF